MLNLLTYSVEGDFSIPVAEKQLVTLLLSSGCRNIGKPTSQSLIFSASEDELDIVHKSLLDDFSSNLYFVISDVIKGYNVFADESSHNQFMGVLSDVSRSLGLDVFEVKIPNITDPIDEDF